MLNRVIASAVAQILEGDPSSHQIGEHERLLHDLLIVVVGIGSAIDDVDIFAREEVEVPDQLLRLNRRQIGTRQAEILGDVGGGGRRRREEEENEEERARDGYRVVPHFQKGRETEREKRLGES